MAKIDNMKQYVGSMITNIRAEYPGYKYDIDGPYGNIFHTDLLAPIMTRTWDIKTITVSILDDMNYDDIWFGGLGE